MQEICLAPRLTLLNAIAPVGKNWCRHKACRNLEDAFKATEVVAPPPSSFPRRNVSNHLDAPASVNTLCSLPLSWHAFGNLPPWTLQPRSCTTTFCLWYSALLREIPHTDIRSRPLYRLQTSWPRQHPQHQDIRQNHWRKQAQGCQSHSETIKLKNMEKAKIINSGSFTPDNSYFAWLNDIKAKLPSSLCNWYVKSETLMSYRYIGVKNSDYCVNMYFVGCLPLADR